MFACIMAQSYPFDQTGRVEECWADLYPVIYSLLGDGFSDPGGPWECLYDNPRTDRNLPPWIMS